jgi:hypothetical protein
LSRNIGNYKIAILDFVQYFTGNFVIMFFLINANRNIAEI